MVREYPGIRRIEPKQEPNLSLYRTQLASAVERFGLTKDSFSSQSQPGAIDTAVRLLSGLQIEPAFFAKPERALYLLAIADTWNYLDQQSAPRSFMEKAGLVNLVKSLAQDEKVSHSQSVRRASAGGWILRGKIFDPENRPNADQEENAAFEQQVNTTVKQHRDEQATRQMRQRLDATGPGTVLHDIRTFAGKIGEPINVVVLDLTTEEMGQSHKGMGAGVGDINGIKTMLLPSDASDQTIQHEAIHFLLPHIAENFLMRGIVEAWVESHTSKPESYLPHRKVLTKITEYFPKLSSTLDEAFRDESGNAKLRFLSMLTEKYSLRGLLLIGRLDPDLYNTYGMGLSAREVITEVWDIMKDRLSRGQLKLYS